MPNPDQPRQPAHNNDSSEPTAEGLFSAKHEMQLYRALGNDVLDLSDSEKADLYQVFVTQRGKVLAGTDLPTLLRLRDLHEENQKRSFSHKLDEMFQVLDRGQSRTFVAELQCAERILGHMKEMQYGPGTEVTHDGRKYTLGKLASSGKTVGIISSDPEYSSQAVSPYSLRIGDEFLVPPEVYRMRESEYISFTELYKQRRS